MSTDISLRITGRVGHITLDRPKALNALTYEMCLQIEQALDAWADDPAVAMIVIDAIGEKAFCAGGDIQEMYRTGTAGDFSYGRKFWRDEYRMNAKLFEFPKPVASFLQGFTMGGGVGVGCHGSHRIVCENSQISMPECGIGLIPDVGGSLILARAPGRLGEYLGCTGARMGPGDALLAGFADYYVPQADWPALKAALIETGNWDLIDQAARPAPDSLLRAQQQDIDQFFSGETFGDILRALDTGGGPFSDGALKALSLSAPLSMACTIEMLHRLRGQDGIRQALGMEYRFTHRAMEHGDFLEGIRAAIIDRDRTPNWQHADMRDVTNVEVTKLLMPLGADSLTFERVAA